MTDLPLWYQLLAVYGAICAVTLPLYAIGKRLADLFWSEDE